MQNHDPRPHYRRTAEDWCWIVGVALVVALLTFGFVIGKGTSHDEHQHVAAGALVGREGLWPYRDFPFFHTPYLPLIYGALFSWSDHLLLTGRIFSAVCATAAVAVVFAVAQSRFQSWAGRRWLALGAALLLLAAPQFSSTTGRAWNHEPAMLFALLGVVACAASFHRSRPGPWLLAAGLLLGLAIGIRITFAPLCGALVLALFFLRWRHLSAPRAGGLLAAGLACALLPAFLLFLAAPEQFVFGNLEFSRVNIIYRHASGSPRTMEIGEKLIFVLKEILPVHLPLVLAVAACVGVAVRHSRRTSVPLMPELKLVLLVLPFLLVGSLAPSPLFEQYFYPFVPFLTLAAVYALASTPPPPRRVTVGLGACVAISAAVGFPEYRQLGDLFTPAEWTPIKCHQSGADLRRALPAGGRVLTLSPTVALEAGCSIDPSFVTGPFAWRIAPFVASERRRKLLLVGPDELAWAIAARPPAAILVGAEEKREKSILSYAKAHGFSRVRLSKDHDLWIPRGEPSPDGNGR